MYLYLFYILLLNLLLYTEVYCKLNRHTNRSTFPVIPTILSLCSYVTEFQLLRQVKDEYYNAI